jgi:hypothetical protein
MKKLAIIGFVVATSVASGAGDTPWAEVEARIDAHVAAAEPIVTHIVVALCDNIHQGIVPVPAHLGNGQKPRENLYWGAAYGVRTFLTKRAGWEIVESSTGTQGGRLERIVLRTDLKRGNESVEAILVADAWDGRFMPEALERFLQMAAGNHAETIDVVVDGQHHTVRASGASTLIGFVGHNGLMDFSLHEVPTKEPAAKPRSALVLACSSKPYFKGILEDVGAHPILLTTGLMAPEAYTLDAAVKAFILGESPGKIRDAAASAYAKYQRCSQKAARRLFSSTP